MCIVLDFFRAAALSDPPQMSLEHGLAGAVPPMAPSAFLYDSNLCPSHGGSLGKLLLAWSAMFITDSRPRCATSTECVRTVSTDTRPLARNNPVYSRSCSFPWTRLWGLTSWGQFRWMFTVQRQLWLSRASPLHVPTLHCRSGVMGVFRCQ